MLAFKKIDLDRITDLDAQNPREHIRDREATLGKRDWAKIDVDDPREIGVGLVTAENDAALNTTVTDADRYVASGFGRKDTRQVRYSEASSRPSDAPQN